MTKRKASTKAKPGPKQPSAEKRKRADISDHLKQSKRVKVSNTDTFPPTKTTAIKQETQECDICVETKPIYRNFPSLPTCSHDATVCSDCYRKHFVTKIDEDREQGWSACTCPSCGEKIEAKDAQAILPRQTSKELDILIKNTAKQSAQNWIWCPGQNCGRGQLHSPASSNKVTCHYCRTESCYKHQALWHKGLTCGEFDQIGNHDANTARSIAEIQRTTKPCPHCKARIKKEGGCNHMICAGCHKNWFWDAVPFDGEQIATSAEVRGGHARSQPLQGAARQAVEQVMRFENARIDQTQAAPNPQVARALPVPITQPNRGIFRTAFDNVITTMFRSIPPTGPAASRLGAGPREVPLLAEGRAEHNQRQQRVQTTSDGMFTRIFGFGNQVRQQNFPVSNMRSTQPGSAQQQTLHSAPRRRQIQPRTSSTAPLVPVIVLEDLEIGTVGRQNTGRTERIQGMRDQINHQTQMIDLTQDDGIIDLTGDD